MSEYTSPIPANDPEDKEFRECLEGRWPKDVIEVVMNLRKKAYGDDQKK